MGRNMDRGRGSLGSTLLLLLLLLLLKHEKVHLGRFQLGVLPLKVEHLLLGLRCQLNTRGHNILNDRRRHYNLLVLL